jgi:hypothetical protein
MSFDLEDFIHILSLLLVLNYVQACICMILEQEHAKFTWMLKIVFYSLSLKSTEFQVHGFSFQLLQSALSFLKILKLMSNCAS